MLGALAAPWALRAQVEAAPPLDFDSNNEMRIIRWEKPQAQEAANYIAQGLAQKWTPYVVDGQSVFYFTDRIRGEWIGNSYECYMLCPGFDPEKPWASTVVDLTKERHKNIRLTGLA